MFWVILVVVAIFALFYWLALTETTVIRHKTTVEKRRYYNKEEKRWERRLTRGQLEIWEFLKQVEQNGIISAEQCEACVEYLKTHPPL